MITKTIQARNLSVGDEIVDGGNGVKRTRNRIQALHRNPAGVTSVQVRVGEVFDTRSFQPRDEVRIVKGAAA